MRRGKPYILRDDAGREITVAEAGKLVAAHHTVPNGIRASRRASRVGVAA